MQDYTVERHQDLPLLRYLWTVIQIMYNPVKRMSRKVKRRSIILGGFLLISVILFWRSLPDPLFSEPYSTVLLDAEGNLLGARVARDHQWRFPPGDTLPERFTASLIMFEDKRFYSHPGIRPGSLARALWQNIRAGEVVSGGSTITMQVVRLWRKGKSRTITEKIVEIVLAIRLELATSKDEVLRLYCAHAPFGGNVVGLEAASWRYFGRPPEKLSWSESATLAVLPNSPGLIYPGRSQKKLKKKRDFLLGRLMGSEVIDSTTYELALAEPLPGKPLPLPSHAYHLLNRSIAEGKSGKRIRSTLSLNLQQKVSKVCSRQQTGLAGKGIFNMSAVVLNVRTGACLAYVGNVIPQQSTGHGEQVDMVNAERSTGSILKPFLYAAMLSEGELLPHMLVEDIPTFAGSFHPENYDKDYAGAIPASGALARSLNVPAVKMLQRFGVDRFHSVLTSIGMRSLKNAPSHYGLTLILGGAEASLWDICGMYAGMGRQLLHFCENDGRYLSNGYHAPYYDQPLAPTGGKPTAYSLPSASASWFTLRALSHVNRPFEELHWRRFSSTTPISWKTGTSFGFRDAWAIATTPEYVVGVWTGNADGEGRPGLTGLQSSAPVLFEILNILSPSGDFPKPYDDMTFTEVCRNSGYRAGPWCGKTDTLNVPLKGVLTDPCPFHAQIFLDSVTQLRVSDRCRSVSELVPSKWFILPPEIEKYYVLRNPLYKKLPPYEHDCAPFEENQIPIALIYPRPNARISIPVDVDGNRSKVVFEAAHRNTGTLIFWFIDGVLAGSTSRFHNLELSPDPGKHLLTLTDADGNTLDCSFEIVDGK